MRESRRVARVIIPEVRTDPLLRLHSSLSPPLAITSSELSFFVTPFDLKRLDSYANNMVDYHVILDLLPYVSSLYFDKRLGEDVNLSPVQASILLGMGLQRKSIEEVEVSGIVVNQGNDDDIDCRRQSTERVVTTCLPSIGVVQQAHTQDQQKVD